MTSFSFNRQPERSDDESPNAETTEDIRKAIETAAAARKRAELYITWLERALTPAHKPDVDRTTETLK